MKRRLLTLAILLLGLTTETPAQSVRGRATYYSAKAHGRRMSNGQRHHRDSLWCAHKTYPLGSVVKVKNLNNEKEVIVTVTDRGPHRKNLTIDLSLAAAKQIDMIRSGIVPVEITLLAKPGESLPEVPDSVLQ